ncbi:hypothetical protein [Bradyrhizobium sp. CCGB01]|uniref:hypothetical protein n=1 Tax=Bradyrhizobium sp. CCGB01 TaxID=2949634 RepID=UPI0020B24917|nr:hypothetical protein [Bradyrhizobium sp. CCGB01]MCP3410447.1 hypothetical protein [Bradyrhizobium sp. CCGB01]
MQRRRRFKQATSLQERLTEFAKVARQRAKAMPPGKDREMLLRQAREADTGSHIEE